MEVTVKLLKPSGNDKSGDEGDRISDLPEHVIHLILSLLDTIDVMRLSLVSRKWRYLWISMPYLSFSMCTFFQDPMLKTKEDFKDLVNWVFMSQGFEFDLKRFRISCLRYNDCTLHRWINILARRKVQELILDFNSFSSFEYSSSPIDLPPSLLTLESLVELKLECYVCSVLKLPSSVGFMQLKSLELRGIEFTDYILFQNFISSCCLLENLKMSWCELRDFKILDISSASLKILSINLYSCLQLYKCELKVACPSFVSFKCFGSFFMDFFFHDLNSLQTFVCSASFPEDVTVEKYQYLLCKILEGVCNIRVLKLCYSKFVHHSLEKPLPSASLYNLKHLQLVIWTGDLPSLINLLKLSPNLEALTIKFCWHKPDEWRIIPDEDIPCLAYHLKVVELFDFSGNENEFDMVRFLLKNGHVLQRMSINWWRGDTISKNFMSRVRKLPRSSSNVALTFEKPRLDASFYELSL